MSNEEILKQLSTLYERIMDQPIQSDKLSPDLLLKEDLGLTSVGVIYLVVAMEDHFNIVMDDVSLGDFNTLGDVVNYLKGKI